MMAPPLIEAKGLTCGYGSTAVVRDVDLEVGAGEIVLLLGPNGAGKTTTVLTLGGELDPMGGSIAFDGSKARAPLYKRARGGLALVTEERSVFMRQSTIDNLKLGRGDIGVALGLFPELESRLKIQAGMLSGGEQQMLTLARALSRRPKVLVIDELSLGLAPLVVERLLAAVVAAARTGVGVLLVEQHVRKALGIADRVYLMRRGSIEFSGSALQAQQRIFDIEESYLSGPVSRNGSVPH